jgi:hypothetical protein
MYRLSRRSGCRRQQEHVEKEFASNPYPDLPKQLPQVERTPSGNDVGQSTVERRGISEHAGIIPSLA